MLISGVCVCVCGGGGSILARRQGGGSSRTVVGVTIFLQKRSIFICFIYNSSTCLFTLLPHLEFSNGLGLSIYVIYHYFNIIIPPWWQKNREARSTALQPIHLKLTGRVVLRRDCIGYWYWLSYDFLLPIPPIKQIGDPADHTHSRGEKDPFMGISAIYFHYLPPEGTASLESWKIMG